MFPNFTYGEDEVRRGREAKVSFKVKERALVMFPNFTYGEDEVRRGREEGQGQGQVSGESSGHVSKLYSTGRMR
ncbi:hypothetical protein RRG08_044156 [Elysia crispata]|uniref:Uncharacterized protein n=1 Tax=Elysia crispata TaxID=231223 RepID=A0AAE1BBW5_9GAST|nr:hypothetical protein RRG08_044156 [Elysia crispata]